jgi:hypothetical protein
MQPLVTASDARRPAYIIEVLAAALVYFATSRLGLELAVVARQVSVIWPATGLALALLVLRGRVLSPAIFLGAFAANVLNDPSKHSSAQPCCDGPDSNPPCVACTMWPRCSCSRPASAPWPAPRSA